MSGVSYMNPRRAAKRFEAVVERGHRLLARDPYLSTQPEGMQDGKRTSAGKHRARLDRLAPPEPTSPPLGGDGLPVYRQHRGPDRKSSKERLPFNLKNHSTSGFSRQSGRPDSNRRTRALARTRTRTRARSRSSSAPPSAC